MNTRHIAYALSLLLAAASVACAQTPPASPSTLTEPLVGTPGKDVVYVPQPSEVVDKMLDVAKLTPRDFVMDLGSGDGRNVIAAARRGARALGVEFNPEFVEYSKRAAKAAGVADKASFVQGDMYEADISQASVLALFLLTENLNKLKPKFLAMKPGSRIVINTFKISGWEPDETVRADDKCSLWCELQLYIVPAQVDGTWHINGGPMNNGRLTLKQDHQMISGTLTVSGKAVPVENGRLRGERISFSAGGVRYEGQVSGGSMRGGSGSTAWSASKAS
jgi:SAM-dependent methyltransferase